jgi:hypothetical protein
MIKLKLDKNNCKVKMSIALSVIEKEFNQYLNKLRYITVNDIKIVKNINIPELFYEFYWLIVQDHEYDIFYKYLLELKERTQGLTAECRHFVLQYMLYMLINEKEIPLKYIVWYIKNLDIRYLDIELNEKYSVTKEFGRIDQLNKLF